MLSAPWLHLRFAPLRRQAVAAATLLLAPACSSQQSGAVQASESQQVSAQPQTQTQTPAATAIPSLAAVPDESAPPLPSAPELAQAAERAEFPRVFSVGQTTWVRKKPELKEGAFLGYIRTGYQVPLHSRERIKGEGCPGGYYQVEPRGYVCADRTVTESPREGFLAAALATRPSDGPFPFSYGLSNGTPMYNRIPVAREQERYERWLGKPGKFDKLPKTLRSHEELAEDRVMEAPDPVPTFLLEGGSPKEAPYDLVEQTIPLGAMLSYTKVFESQGRPFVLSTDHTIVPADRVRPFRPSSFQGTELAPGAVELPIAWMRVSAKKKFLQRNDTFEEAGEAWPVRTFVGLTGREINVGKTSYLETREEKAGAPLFIRKEDATVASAETKRASGVKEGQKWFMIRLSAGTLVAYEDLKPTYATLVSPGKGGVPSKGNDNVEHSTTPLGAYSITFKDRFATMSPETGKNRSFWIQDVPHTMYFDPPFAMHAAFWHERFGEFVSAGCINLSPLDAKRLFDWADPMLPADWQGVTGAGASENGATTIVVVRR